jgi:hypothetical protein
MVIDDARKTQIQEVFKQILDYKELVKDHNAIASSLMKGLVESLSKDKQERKELKKILTKAFKEWKEDISGEPDTITEALEIVSKIKK